MKKLVILGAGTGGTLMARHLTRRLDRSAWSITVVDRDTDHYYQPGFLFIPFGLYERAQLVKDRSRFLPKGVEFTVAEVERIDAAANAVVLEDGRSLPYDMLIVATGAEIVPAELAGSAEGWRDTIFDFYTPEGSEALARALEVFPGGRLVVHIQEMPIKCPVVPIEFALLADWHFTRRRMRRDVEITFVTPLGGPFTRPIASRKFGGLFDERGIGVVGDFVTERVDAAARKLVCYDGREVPYDLLVTIPTNMGAGFVERSGLGDELRFIPVDAKTLQSKSHDNIFVIGDASDAPTAKAGSVVHFQAEILTENVLRAIEGKPLAPDLDGHANCFIATGFRKAILIDYNYDIEPLHGRFPIPVLGPLPMLKESRLNHLGKLAFRHMYWRWLLKGRPFPFVPDRLSMAGKKRPPSD
ncbi:MAG: NAD(P)/FAD-dependent oxidoreductase [Candidatus Aminicenantes bacterium]|nr:NAD(P)/FAD-dependent oxidoreductase [Candidatus Aminicenantes bacterium]